MAEGEGLTLDFVIAKHAERVHQVLNEHELTRTTGVDHKLREIVGNQGIQDILNASRQLKNIRYASVPLITIPHPDGQGPVDTLWLTNTGQLEIGLNPSDKNMHMSVAELVHIDPSTGTCTVNGHELAVSEYEREDAGEFIVDDKAFVLENPAEKGQGHLLGYFIRGFEEGGFKDATAQSVEATLAAGLDKMAGELYPPTWTPPTPSVPPVG